MIFLEEGFRVLRRACGNQIACPNRQNVDMCDARVVAAPNLRACIGAAVHAATQRPNR